MSERSRRRTGWAGIPRVWSLGCALVGLWFATGISPARGQCPEQQKLAAADAATGDNFGVSVAVSGDTAVVGSHQDDDAGTDSGSAYVYIRTGGVWTQQQKLTASDAAAGDNFGALVSVNGDTIVVGAFLDDDAGSGSGSAYVFVRSGTVWSQQQKLTASDAAANDEFGGSVSVNGDTVVVGAYNNDDAGTNSGSAYVYIRTGTVWTQQQKLTAADAAAGDNFGVSVSVSGDTAVVGSHVDDSNTGSAYVFVRSGTVWTQQQKLTAVDAATGDHFGASVSVTGNTAAIGAYTDSDAGSSSGSAYVFLRSGTVWTQQQKLTASDAAANDEFGGSVSVDGDTVVVGAYNNDDAGTDSGSAYKFARSGAIWTQQQKLTASDAAAGDQFGWSVAVSGDTAVVGSHLDDNAGADSGSAYTFQCCSPPDCNNHGTCVSGSCACNVGFVGAGCDQCGPNYFNYPTCTFCQAATTCSGNGTCNASGGCDCNVGFVGAACNACGPNYFNYPTCTFCLAATTCSGNGVCTPNGNCVCNVGFVGAACDQCAPNYFNYPTCTFCQAATTCSGNGTCNGLGGCNCDPCWTGANCATGAVAASAASAPFDRLKNRYISFTPGNCANSVAFRVAKTTAPTGSCWVQAPVPSGNDQYTAKCAASPVFRVWNEPVIHVGDCAIIPVASYEVYTNAPGPVENPTPLTINTILLPSLNNKLWGDNVGINNGSEWTPPNQFTNVNDVLSLLAFISGATIRPHFTVANLQAISSADSCLNAQVNASDVLIVVQAIAGASYGPPSSGKITNPGLCPGCP